MSCRSAGLSVQQFTRSHTGAFGRTFIALLGILLGASMGHRARAWDAPGHRMITGVALDAFVCRVDDAAIAFLREPGVRAQVADQSVVPDRWRGVTSASLAHVNNPDHYIDLEDVEALGIRVREMHPLRHEWVRQLALAQAAQPEPHLQPQSIPPVNPATDTAKTAMYPGFLPHAISEQYARVVSALRVLRILAAINEPSRQPQLDMARANAKVQLGLLSHYVGDAAQPLHTTRHHHGWEGDNPQGYTTDRRFHARIDGDVLRHHAITEADIRTQVRRDANDPTPTPTPTSIPARTPEPWCRHLRQSEDLDAQNPWTAVLDHILRSHEEVEALYRLEKSGALDQAEGRTLIVERLADGAGMLAALYQAAWTASEPSARNISDFRTYDQWPGQEADQSAGQ